MARGPALAASRDLPGAVTSNPADAGGNAPRQALRFVDDHRRIESVGNVQPVQPPSVELLNEPSNHRYRFSGNLLTVSTYASR
jgi:hypothetical protein